MAIDSMRCVRILVAISINDVIDFGIDSIQFNTIKNTCIYVYRTHVMGTHICQEAALIRRTSWRRSGGRVGFGPSGEQLHPATPELTAWRERPADGSQ